MSAKRTRRRVRDVMGQRLSRRTVLRGTLASGARPRRRTSAGKASVSA